MESSIWDVNNFDPSVSDGAVKIPRHGGNNAQALLR
jgi:hypothetical protein